MVEGGEQGEGIVLERHMPCHTHLKADLHGEPGEGCGAWWLQESWATACSLDT